MDGQELRRWRLEQGLTQREVAAILNDATGRRYTPATIGRWENGRDQLSRTALDFFENGGTSSNPAAAGTPPENDGNETGAVAAAAAPPRSGGDAFTDGADLPPLPQAGQPSLALVAHDQALAKACEELWDMLGFGLVVMGQGLGKPALRNDGQIICGWEDASGRHEGMKRELGVAYGKLAERNRTFQRIVLALSAESVWAEIAVVTVKLCKAMYDNHVNVNRVLRERAEAARLQAQQPTYEEPMAA